MSERKKIFLSVVITFVATALLCAVVFNAFATNPALNEIKSIIKSKYIEEFDESEFDEYAAMGAVASLGDKYSYYLSEENYNALVSDLSGSYRGIGVQVYINAVGELEITDIFNSSPAAESGLCVGDIIVKVGGFEANAQTYAEAIERIRGTENDEESVSLTIRRGGETFEVSVMRSEIVAETVFVKNVEGFRYIRISSFNTTTTDEFKAALDNSSPDCPGIIIDLRDNPGGLFDVVTKIADMLLPKCDIVYTQTRQGSKQNYSGRKDGIDTPLVILTNNDSASASEVLAGAIKDNKRGTLVGERTFGKGCVQEIFKLRSGGALKLTTMYYYTPSGVCIQDTGITPDIEVSLPEEADGIIASQLPYEKDTQLQKAVEILKNN